MKVILPKGFIFQVFLKIRFFFLKYKINFFFSYSEIVTQILQILKHVEVLDFKIEVWAPVWSSGPLYPTSILSTYNFTKVGLNLSFDLVLGLGLDIEYSLIHIHIQPNH